MYGADAYGSVPYGESSFGPEALFDTAAMLASSRAQLVYTVELKVWNIAAQEEETLYLGSAAWETAPTDVPASQPFDGRLTTALNFSRSTIGDRIGINHTSGQGTIAFLNTDGAYDDTIDDFTIDGREVIVRIGRKTDAFANHRIIFRGVAVDWSGDDTVTITVRDSFDLDRPAQPNVYAGTGGAEGGDDLAGKRKPLTFGFTYGVPITAVDLVNLIYQFHDNTDYGWLLEVLFVYDRGASLTYAEVHETYAALAASPVSAGMFEYSRDGYIKLGAPPDGTLFAYAQVVDAANPITARARDVVGAIVGASGVGRVDHASLHALSTSLMTLHVGASDSYTYRTLISALMAGLGGWVGLDRQGALTVGRLFEPAGSPVAYFGRAEGDIIDLKREKMPAGVWPPPWRWRVAYDRNYTVFTDFAGAISETIKARHAEPYRLAEASDDTILVDHPGALDPPPVEAFFGALVTSEADRLLTLYSSGYRLYRVTLGRAALLREIGDEINITWPRYGFEAGKNGIIVAMDDRIEQGDGSGVEKVEVVVFA